MKNIKKKLDYKNYIYLSFTRTFSLITNRTVIRCQMHYHKYTYEYFFGVPDNNDVDDISYRLSYNLPKRKLVKILWKKEDIQCLNQNIN